MRHGLFFRDRAYDVKSMRFSGPDIMFSSNDNTPRGNLPMLEKMGAIINLDDITHIQCLEETLGYILRPSAAVLIRAVCSKSAMTSWTIPGIPNTG